MTRNRIFIFSTKGRSVLVLFLCVLFSAVEKTRSKSYPTVLPLRSEPSLFSANPEEEEADEEGEIVYQPQKESPFRSSLPGRPGPGPLNGPRFGNARSGGAWRARTRFQVPPNRGLPLYDKVPGIPSVDPESLIPFQMDGQIVGMDEYRNGPGRGRRGVEMFPVSQMQIDSPDPIEMMMASQQQSQQPQQFTEAQRPQVDNQDPIEMMMASQQQSQQPQQFAEAPRPQEQLPELRQQQQQFAGNGGGGMRMPFGNNMMMMNYRGAMMDAQAEENERMYGMSPEDRDRRSFGRPRGFRNRNRFGGPRRNFGGPTSDMYSSGGPRSNMPDFGGLRGNLNNFGGPPKNREGFGRNQESLEGLQNNMEVMRGSRNSFGGPRSYLEDFRGSSNRRLEGPGNNPEGLEPQNNMEDVGGPGNGLEPQNNREGFRGPGNLEGLGPRNDNMEAFRGSQSNVENFGGGFNDNMAMPQYSNPFESPSSFEGPPADLYGASQDGRAFQQTTTTTTVGTPPPRRHHSKNRQPAQQSDGSSNDNSYPRRASYGPYGFADEDFDENLMQEFAMEQEPVDDNSAYYSMVDGNLRHNLDEASNPSLMQFPVMRQGEGDDELGGRGKGKGSRGSSQGKQSSNAIANMDANALEEEIVLGNVRRQQEPAANVPEKPVDDKQDRGGDAGDSNDASVLPTEQQNDSSAGATTKSTSIANSNARQQESRKGATKRENESQGGKSRFPQPPRTRTSMANRARTGGSPPHNKNEVSIKTERFNEEVSGPANQRRRYYPDEPGAGMDPVENGLFGINDLNRRRRSALAGYYDYDEDATAAYPIIAPVAVKVPTKYMFRGEPLYTYEFPSLVYNNNKRRRNGEGPVQLLVNRRRKSPRPRRVVRRIIRRLPAARTRQLRNPYHHQQEQRKEWDARENEEENEIEPITPVASNTVTEETTSDSSSSQEPTSSTLETDTTTDLASSSSSTTDSSPSSESVDNTTEEISTTTTSKAKSTEEVSVKPTHKSTKEKRKDRHSKKN